GATGQLRPEGRDEGWSHRNPLGRHGDHSELANLASYLISDQAGFINGEMVVQDGGSHLRSSGAGDLLQWTEERWERHGAGRTEKGEGGGWEGTGAQAGRGRDNCLPKQAFPGYPSRGRGWRGGPSSGHNDGGTRPDHGAANSHIAIGGRIRMRGRKSRAGAR